MDSDLQQYCETALWAGIDQETGRPLDRDFWLDDIQPDALAELAADVAGFMNDPELAEALEYWRAELGDTQAAHDFFLTRNGHGAGFWDRFMTEPGASFGKLLTAAAKVYGTQELQRDSDDTLYLTH